MILCRMYKGLWYETEDVKGVIDSGKNLDLRLPQKRPRIGDRKR